MEKHNPSDINEKLRKLTREQSNALAASLNEVYIRAARERKNNTSLSDKTQNPGTQK